MVSIDYNSDSYSFYLEPIFLKFPELEKTLLEDFRTYKSTGMLPDYFGRDTVYERPSDIQDAGLWHIHLEIDGNKFKAPPASADLQDPKVMQWYRTSDTALVYAKGLIDENSYSLIAVFMPPAHQKAQDEARMRILASYARDFSQKID